MQRNFIRIALLLLSISAFFLACRTASLLSGEGVAQETPTRARVTRASQRPTFTPIPPPSDTPEPTETPEPSEPPPPTDEPLPPTATRRPPTARPRPTNTNVPPTKTPQPSPTPTTAFAWIQDGAQSCEGGGDSESSVTGKITANNTGAVGQKVQASSGPGGEPISENPAESDKHGNYKVTFLCSGKACNGDFYIWMVDAGRHQVSPFVKFHFDSGCRKGKQNFKKR